MSWEEIQHTEKVSAFLQEMGFAKNRWEIPSPSLGRQDKRFDPLLQPHGVRCCRRNGKYRWCYAKAVLRVGDDWYCKKHLKTAPLPSWDNAPDLHYRPHHRNGDNSRCWIQGPHNPRVDEEWWFQTRVLEELECTADSLWSFVVGVHSRNIPTHGGFRQKDGTVEPFCWRPEDVRDLREKMRAEAAEKVLGLLGVENEEE